MGIVLGLLALALVLLVVGLAYGALKWLVAAAVVVLLLGVLRAYVSTRSNPGGPER